jgi:hypothetical protein
MTIPRQPGEQPPKTINHCPAENKEIMEHQKPSLRRLRPRTGTMFASDWRWLAGLGLGLFSSTLVHQSVIFGLWCFAGSDITSI